MELNRVCGGGIGESNSGAAVVGFHDPVPQRALTENIQMKAIIPAPTYEEFPDGSCFTRPRQTAAAAALPRSKTMMASTTKQTSFMTGGTIARAITASVTRKAKYLGSFPVQAADQSGRAEFVRRQLLTMKDVPTKRDVLIVISLAGIKVCCPQGKTIHTWHTLRRVSYATCEPSTSLTAFLAREANAPLHRQNCHVFAAVSPEAAEEINTLIGNAFRVAYAVQLQEEQQQQQHGQMSNRRTLTRQSRSVDSLLEGKGSHHDYDNDDILLNNGEEFEEEENIYEFAGDNNIMIRPNNVTTNARTKSTTMMMMPPPPPPIRSQHSQLTSPQPQEPLSTILQISRSNSSSNKQQPTLASFTARKISAKPPTKPNTLPVLNCLFAALNNKNNSDEGIEDDTPYCDVTMPFTANNNLVNNNTKNHHLLGLNRSSTRTFSSGTNSESSSGGSSGGADSMQRNNGFMNKSKSAHFIGSANSDYAEVVDAATPSTTTTTTTPTGLHPNTFARNGKRFSTGTRYRTHQGHHQQQQHQNGGGSSGFSSGEASCSTSSGTTPPPAPSNSSSLHTISHVMVHCDIEESGQNNAAEEDIMDEPELQTAPWFQSGVPRNLALEVLRREPEGAFLVRESNSRSGGLALSVRVPLDFHPGGIAHYLIVRAPKGFRIKGCPKQFPSITSLLVHHSVMPEMLPCPLSLNRYNPTFRPGGEDPDDPEEEIEAGGDYLDPDRDYEAIAMLRRGLLNGEQDEEEHIYH